MANGKASSIVRQTIKQELKALKDCPISLAATYVQWYIIQIIDYHTLGFLSIELGARSVQA